MASVLALFGCKEAKDPALAAFEAHLLSKLDFPDTYQFISMEKIDSITYQQMFDDKIELFSARYYRDGGNELAEMENVRKALGDTIGNVAGYKYKFAFSVELPVVGETKLVEYAMITPYNEVLEVSLDEDIYVSPLRMPGYDKVVGLD